MHKEKPHSLDNVVEGTVKEAIFMGDAYHCKIAVGDDVLAVHTHPFQRRQPGGEGLPPFGSKELQWSSGG